MAARALCIQGSPVPSTTACTLSAASPSTTPSSHVLSDTAMSASAVQQRPSWYLCMVRNRKLALCVRSMRMLRCNA